MNCSCQHMEGQNCIEMVPIFSHLSKDEMTEIALITRQQTFNKGELVYLAGDKGDKLYVIHVGKVKIARLSEAGKEQVIRVLGPGEFMGELSLFSGSVLTDNAEALEETSICLIEADKVKRLVEKNPLIALKIMEELGQRLEKAENLLQSITLLGVERRLAKALLEMADGGNMINLKMSKRDFASHLGMTQETLSRKLSSMQDMGVIALQGQRQIRILDSSALAAIE